MAAPERFAEMSDSSCTAGAVHTWHFRDMPTVRDYVCLWGSTGSELHAVKATRMMGWTTPASGIECAKG
jgi:hypothetical protein